MGNLRQQKEEEQLCLSHPSLFFWLPDCCAQDFLQCSDENLAYIILTAGVTEILKIKKLNIKAKCFIEWQM
ncbi:hypothetical protein [Flavobacterium sp.]|uniref:hypothetical protein n=1 Tax=Flavobacterium sp. TaxID=239 RepID=UPI003751BDE9